jgi:pimeloyl-ACP methyl ester carboxylesterase
MKGNVCAGSPQSLKNKQNVDKFTFVSLGNWDWTTSLNKAVAPTLIIQGELDPLPIESARKWAAAMPNARLLELKGIGHFPYVEAPDVFFAAVDRFLMGEWPDGAIR